jgi:hypothetical protein|tara:strand:+ start:93 stop:392 length:300 start_codon:yes stop_codon:yes gene_type:complete
MPMKNAGRKVYKSANGKTVDMDLLRQKNELTTAVGNARVNARGDELGEGGKIIRKKEDILADYYASNPGVKEEAPISQDEKDLTDDWIEDENGNFVQRG